MRDATGVQQTEVRDGIQHPAVHGAAPTSENCPARKAGAGGEGRPDPHGAARRAALGSGLPVWLRRACAKTLQVCLLSPKIGNKTHTW